MTLCLIEDKVLIEKVYPFQAGGFSKLIPNHGIILLNV